MTRNAHSAIGLGRKAVGAIVDLVAQYTLEARRFEAPLRADKVASIRVSFSFPKEVRPPCSG